MILAKKLRKTQKKPTKAKRSAFALRLRKFFKTGFISLLAIGLVGLLVLDYHLRSRFSGSKWSLPSHVYSRALELYEGLELSRDGLVWELEKLGYRRVAKLSAAGQYRVQGRRVAVHSRAFQFWDESKAAQTFILTFQGSQLTELHSLQGKSLALVRLEPLRIGGIYPAHLEDRLPVRLEELPPLLVESLIAVEDRGFYQHYGVSLRGISRALLNNLRPGSATQGGSTITQQLVKNLYLSRDRTLLRKGLEAVMALMLEQHYSKGEIIEAYINEIYLGQAGKRAIHGFGMASQHYFNQPLAELNLHQIALLVAIAKGASYYDPRRHGERALTRRNLVIKLLAEQGLIDNAIASRASQQALGLAARPGTRTNPFPAYLDLVKRQLRKDYEDEDLRSGGLRVFTHFDPQAQNRLEKIVSTKLAAMERQKGLKDKPIEAASLLVRVGTAEVLALVGGRESRFAGFNRALDARRPIGSTIKPAVYLTALEQPDDYTLQSLISDAPVAIPAAHGETWRPRNFDHKSHGEVPLYQAMGKSYNLATARLGMALGLDRVVATLRRLGYEGPLAEVPALLLGAVSMSPFDVASLYHTIAAGGFYSPLASIDSVYSAENQPLKRYPYRVESRFDAASMHLLQYAMQVVMREGTGRSAYRYLADDIAVAGKTGTSNDQRDSWFSGFGDDYLAVVWLGRDDNGKMPFTGSSGALQIWSELMADLKVRPLAFARPDNIVYHWVDPQLGLLSEEDCEGARYLPFIIGSEPEASVACRSWRAGKFIDWFKGLLN
ncbi:MAG: penicillin-binding protein 1B [Gammaproteobacteria bacterium]|nr:penicillin-binding protein 1B [Gammaproteobacteria bacterium]MBQ0840873.1 penicillin-binding protein 1B [Gammaproteobacteria bacterium]